MGSGEKEPPWVLEASPRARSAPGRRRRAGGASARGRSPDTRPAGRLAGAARGGRGPAAQIARTKPARAGPGYSQQEAHVGRGVGGGREASGGTAAEVTAARGEAAKRKARRRRRRGAPARRPQQLVRLRYFQRQAEGAEVGSARPESLRGEEKGEEAGQRPQARAARTAALRPRCCNPRRRVLRPRGPHPANSRESNAHPLRPSGCGHGVPPVPDTFAAPGHAPRVRRGHQPGRGLPARLG